MFMNAPFLVVGKVGVTELIVVLLIVLVLFGPKQLPKLSKMFGQTIKNFKKGMEDADEDEAEKAVTSEPAKAAVSEEKSENAEGKTE